MTRHEFGDAFRQRMRNVVQKIERERVVRSDADSSAYALKAGTSEYLRAKAERDQVALRVAATNLDAAVDQLADLFYDGLVAAGLIAFTPATITDDPTHSTPPATNA